MRHFDTLTLRHIGNYGKGECCLCGCVGVRCEAALVTKNKRAKIAGAPVCGICWEDAPFEAIYTAATRAATKRGRQ